jgi:hypothetical protein
MKYVQAEARSAENEAYVNFVKSMDTITSTSTGVFDLFQSAAEIEPGKTVSYPHLVKQISEINSELEGRSVPFVQSINQISSSQLAIETPGTNIYKHVAPLVDSTVELLFKQMQNFLYVNFPVFPNATSDIVPSITEYNQQITYVFQISAAALQAAYVIDASINQINYHKGELDPGAAPATKMETNPGLYYDPGTDKKSVVATYSAVQQQLALVYAARYDQLLQLATSYIISDAPFSDYTYPSIDVTGNLDLDKFYSGQSYKDYFINTVPSSDMKSSLTTGQNFPIIDVTNSDGYIFYMFDGLNEFADCQDAFVNNKALTPNNCQSIYASYPTASEPGSYDGQNLSVWFMSPSTNKPIDAEYTNLAARCDEGSMPNSTWSLTSAFVNYNSTAGFSCPPNNSVTQQSSAAYSPNWTYDPASFDPDNTFTWQNRNTVYLWVSGDTSSLSGGNITVETAQVSNGTQISLGLNSNNDYQGGLAFDVNWTDEGDSEIVSFPFYCPTYDPICTSYDGGGSSQGPGICFGGRYLT